MFWKKKKQEVKPIPFCIDCVYFKDQRTAFFHRCTRPELAKVCVVTGEADYAFCDLERGHLGNCGRKGKYFVAATIAQKVWATNLANDGE